MFVHDDETHGIKLSDKYNRLWVLNIYRRGLNTTSRHCSSVTLSGKIFCCYQIRISGSGGSLGQSGDSSLTG